MQQRAAFLVGVLLVSSATAKVCVELFQKLDDFAVGNLSRHKISSGPQHLGRQLAKLTTTPAWHGKLERTERRVGGREANRPQACWKISI